MRRYLIFLVLFLIDNVSIASVNPEKNIKAIRVFDDIKIDGKLSEEIWNSKEKATNFIQTEPIPGIPATFETHVYFLYDNNAIYVGAKMFDPNPSKILHELSLRDQIGNADNFAIFLDTYKSGLNGFNFLVTASGVQVEGVVTNNAEDRNWNAVWESSVLIDENGWTAEIKIPYSSLRFPSKEIQDWNVQFTREIRRFREKSNWSPIDPTINGWVQQSGKVTDIKKIKSPVRLSLTPYISGYLNTTYQPNEIDNKFLTGNAYSAGLDLKYGLNDAFTLDMTLIPDFGQVISDRQVLNLSPFEVFFEENRQFFTEGTELFNRNQLFYSRRIGGKPLHNSDIVNRLRPGETIINNPEISQLYNATKISGRTSSGTGIGAFNALVGEENAIIRNQDGIERTIKTNPFTNYNAIVIDQNLKNNSFVSLINTNVLRLGDDYDANVTGISFNFKTKDQRFFIGGSGALSQKIFLENTNLGYTYNVSAGKISGNWTYEAGHKIESENYDPNDMGFLLSPNEQNYYIKGSYTQFKPKNDKLQQVRYSGNAIYSRLYKPDVFTDIGINFDNFILWKSRFAIGFNTKLIPFQTFNYFEPRTSDFSQALAIPENYQIGGFLSSDYRKPFACDVQLSFRKFNSKGRFENIITIKPRFRFNDKLSLFTSTIINHVNDEIGYVNKKFAITPIDNFEENDILMGIRNRLIIENSITGRYIFNSIMGINIRIRHYWDRVLYQQFGRLQNDGHLAAINYNGYSPEGQATFDRNVNIFNIDLQYNWRFAPGSDIIFVWKNQIYNSDKSYERDYLTNLGRLFNANQTNNFSIRFLYFLDYLYVFPRKELV